jgi:hypothetical protein
MRRIELEPGERRELHRFGPLELEPAQVLEPGQRRQPVASVGAEALDDQSLDRAAPRRQAVQRSGHLVRVRAEVATGQTAQRRSHPAPLW